MEITITGRHMEVTEAMKTHARQKLEKLTRFFDRIQKVNLTLTVERNRHLAELIINVPHGNTVVVSEESESMYNTLDLLVAKTERQLKKFKEKIKEHRPKQRDSVALKLNQEIEEI